jgi:hypothetical protein
MGRHISLSPGIFRTTIIFLEKHIYFPGPNRVAISRGEPMPDDTDLTKTWEGGVSEMGIEK